MDPVISARGLGKSYPVFRKPHHRLVSALTRGRLGDRQEKWVLRDVSFEVARGETIGIIGRNGAGKSTLLELVCGTLTPTEGSVTVNGRVAALLQLGSGFNPDFTGRENVLLNGQILGLREEQIRGRLASIEEFAGIGDYIGLPVRTYSSGMLMRLAFAVVAHVDADVLIIDEALSVGDVFFSRKCVRFLREFMTRGTIFFVSHDLGAVMNLANRAILLDNGRVEMIGAPRECGERYLEMLFGAEGEISAAPQAAASPAAQSQPEPPAASPGPAPEPPPGLAHLLDNLHESASFGTGAVTIDRVELQSRNGSVLRQFAGGEAVRVLISAFASQPVGDITFGFMVSDRLGQYIFGDNSFQTYAGRSIGLEAGKRATATFDFVVPRLAPGDYVVAAAVAEGTQDSFIAHHWIHDALVIKSNTRSVCSGLVGIPMDRIEVAVDSVPECAGRPVEAAGAPA